MAERVISTWNADDGGKAEITFSTPSEEILIKYYDSFGYKFYNEDWSDASISFCEERAQDWCVGKIELGDI